MKTRNDLVQAGITTEVAMKNQEWERHRKRIEEKKQREYDFIAAVDRIIAWSKTLEVTELFR